MCLAFPDCFATEATVMFLKDEAMFILQTRMWNETKYEISMERTEVDNNREATNVPMIYSKSNVDIMDLRVFFSTGYQ